MSADDPERPTTVARRDFLAGLASIALVGCGRKTDPPVSGGFVDDGGARGHRVRDGANAGTPQRTERVSVVIVGGGVAGLSAAWQLERRGFTDFVVLELEDDVGGNARSGRNEVSAYPWAAHYVPVPGLESTLVRELFEELGVLHEGVWDETMLVYSPDTRLFRWGRWWEGLEEPLAETGEERRAFARFLELIQEARGSRQYTIPSALGAPESSSLDGVSMEHWLEQRGLGTPALRWYVDYACRDDYGALARDVSAWAGLHYFASRPAENEGPLAWPEGNGWIVARLLERLSGKVRTGAPVTNVALEGTGALVRVGSVDYVCDAVVWAAPLFLASHVVDGAPEVDWSYSPWVTANLTLSRQPASDEPGTTWENILFDSPALGYVVANHQTLRTHHEQSVWTWYMALADLSPGDARAMLLRRSWSDWMDFILGDLELAHPDIRRCVTRVDVMRLGHAMVRPTPGFLSSPERRYFREADGPVVYANSDLSGLSLFEEAQYRGVAAADRVLERLGRG